MSKSNKFLMLVSLLPFLFVLTFSLLNLDKKIKLRILIWETPVLSLGSSIAISSLAGFLVGTIPGLIIRSKTISKRRKVIYQQDFNEYNSEDELEQYQQSENIEPPIYLQRDVRDPSPTLSVPYKIIKQSQEFTYQYSEGEQGSFTQESQKDANQEDNYNNQASSNESNSIDWLNVPSENW